MSCRIHTQQHPPIRIFCKDTATTEIYTLSLHDALPISTPLARPPTRAARWPPACSRARRVRGSEQATSAIQSRPPLACPLILGKTTPLRRPSTTAPPPTPTLPTLPLLLPTP